MVKDVKPSSPTLSPAPTKVVTLDDLDSSQNFKRTLIYVATAIALALGGYFGWEFYQNHGGRLDTASAQAFAAVQNRSDAISAATQNDSPTPEQQKQLVSDTSSLQSDIANFVKAHPNNVYTWQALMLQAKQQADSEDFKAAITTLKQASQLSVNDDGLTAIATLRYAQALLANGQADEAKTALAATLPAAFDASKNELLGDIANAKNDKKAAADYYQKAWAQIEARNKPLSKKEDRASLRIKLEGLGIAVTVPDSDGGLVAKPVATAPESATVATPQPALSAATVIKKNSPTHKVTKDNPATKSNDTPKTSKPTAKDDSNGKVADDQ